MDSVINGIAKQVSRDRMVVGGNFGLHIHITSDATGDSTLQTEVEQHGEMICFKYTHSSSLFGSNNVLPGRVVTLRITTSLISQEMATLAMTRELPLDQDFDAIALLAKGVWNK